MKKDDKVYIPRNVKKELEFFRGFGVKELIITIIVAVISIIPVILIYKYISQIFAISFFMIVVTSTIMLVLKNENNMSFYKQLKLVVKNIFMQKNFKYGNKK
ncbi:MAG: PrgI family protein [Bacilli bacterium]|nr:PrgI family protein [Bacilli bacterium]